MPVCQSLSQNVAASFLPVDSPRSFCQSLFIQNHIGTTMTIRILSPLMSTLLLSASFALFAPAHAQDALPPGERPAEFTPENIEKGRLLYKQMCLRCHGPEMVGGNNAFDLRKFPLDDKARFFNSVKNGKRAMPALKDILTEEQITILWSYVGTRGGKL